MHKKSKLPKGTFWKGMRGAWKWTMLVCCLAAFLTFLNTELLVGAYVLVVSVVIDFIMVLLLGSIVFLFLERRQLRSKKAYILGGIVLSVITYVITLPGFIPPADAVIFIWSDLIWPLLEVLAVFVIAGAIAAYAFWKTAVERYQNS